MVQGNLLALTPAHLALATKTGLAAIAPALLISFTRHARHFANKWTSSVFLGICGFVADTAIHSSHYPGEYTEAALTGIGTFLLSIAIASTPVGKRIDRLAEAFHENGHDSAARAVAPPHV